MPAGLFDVGELRLGDGFLKVKKYSLLRDIHFNASMPWRGQGNTRKWTLIASFYQGRKLPVDKKVGVEHPTWSSLPEGSVGRGDSQCLHGTPALSAVYTNWASSGLQKTDPPDPEKPTAAAPPAPGGSACRDPPCPEARMLGHIGGWSYFPPSHLHTGRYIAAFLSLTLARAFYGSELQFPHLRNGEKANR